MNPIPKSILVTGAGGLLGSPLIRALKSEGVENLTAMTHRELDITDESAVRRACDTCAAELIVNCAAYTKVDDCEVNEALAMSVNGDGAGNVARVAAATGSRLIHISTDYVFAGGASSPYEVDHPTGDPAKLSAYGRSKLGGEQQILESGANALIVRTAWLYGPDGPGFPDAILRRARDMGHLKVVNDQRGSPTYAPDLAEAIVRLARLYAMGIVHVTNDGECTWYHFAQEILRLAGLEAPVEPCSTVEFPRPARRPDYSVLSNRRYIELVGSPLRPWQEAIREYMKDRAESA